MFSSDKAQNSDDKQQWGGDSQKNAVHTYTYSVKREKNIKMNQYSIC